MLFRSVSFRNYLSLLSILFLEVHCHCYLCCYFIFIAAVSCPQIEYSSLSECGGPSISIKEQETANIKYSNEKGEDNENRNIHREGPARQKKSIALVSWGGLFACGERNARSNLVRGVECKHSLRKIICVTPSEMSTSLSVSVNTKIFLGGQEGCN